MRRASTFFADDRRIAPAMEFIRRHDCEEGLLEQDDTIGGMNRIDY